MKNKVINIAVRIGILISFLAIGFYAGIMFYEVNAEPKVVIETIQLPAPEPEIIVNEIVKEVRVEVPVIKEVEVYQPLKHFESLESLITWLSFDDTNTHITLTVHSDGNLDFNTACEQFALQLQERALEQGYIINLQGIGTFTDGVLIGRGHMVNSTIIGNDVYFIEPQTDEVWVGARLE